MQKSFRQDDITRFKYSENRARVVLTSSGRAGTRSKSEPKKAAQKTAAASAAIAAAAA